MGSAERGSTAFGALSDANRRAILLILSERGETTVSEIAEALGHIGRANVSTHLRVLREAGLVTERRDGKYRRYSLRTAPVDDVVAFLSQLYSASLDDLKRAAETGRGAPDASGGTGTGTWGNPWEASS